MGRRKWDEIDAEMERLGHFEDISRSQVLRRAMGKRAIKSRLTRSRGEDKIANIVVKRCSG